MHMFVAPLTLLLERLAGYPEVLMGFWGHPVMWFGRLIELFEAGTNKPQRTPEQRRNAGILSVALLVILVLAVSLFVQNLVRQWPLGWMLEIMLASPFLAQKELGRAVRAVAEALGLSIEAGRAEVSHIVGRDPDGLDAAGVCRAAIETLAESTSDGVVAPWFWLVLFGLPGIVVYKAINTADSMIGHRNERYRDYGWAAARLDDIVNWLPARLTALLITFACFFVPQASPGKAWAVAIRDARKHASPNAGWPEAAFAGALGFQLGGPRSYDGVMLALPAFGDGKRALETSDIVRALRLYRATLAVLAATSLVIAVLALSAQG